MSIPRVFIPKDENRTPFLYDSFGDRPEVRIAVCRELTLLDRPEASLEDVQLRVFERAEVLRLDGRWIPIYLER